MIELVLRPGLLRYSGWVGEPEPSALAAVGSGCPVTREQSKSLPVLGIPVPVQFGELIGA